MPKSQLQTPDSISERQIQTKYTDLDPAVKAMSEFQGATYKDVAAPYQTSPLTQLGSALKDLNPALQNVGVEYAKVRDEQAEATAIRLKTENPEMLLAQAVSRGNLPAGASPAFIRAFNMTDLKTKAQRFNGELYKAYDESGLAGVDDPAAFDNFVAKFRADYWKNATQNDKGVQQYTDLEIEKSQFGQMIDNHVGSLRGQHIQHRVAERTQQGLEAASGLAGTYMDELFRVAERNRDYKTVAAQMQNAFKDPVTGVVSHGIHYTAMNNALVDLVATKVAETGDESMWRLLEHMPTSKGNNLATGAYARAKIKATSDAVMSDKIREDNYNWQYRERQAMLNAGLSPEQIALNKAADEKRKVELWERADRKFEHEMFMAAKAERGAYIEQFTDSHASRILTGFTAHDMNNPKVKASFEWLKQNNWRAWTTINDYITTKSKEAKAFTDTSATELAAATLRYQMSSNPQSFDMTEILAKANSGLINPARVQPLLDDWERIRTHQDHPFIQDFNFQELMKRARESTQQNERDKYGMGVIKAEDAAFKLRDYAYTWIKDNPKGTQIQFLKDVKGQLEGIMLDTNEKFKRKQEAAEKKANTPAKQEDTRSGYEKVAPKLLGGKDAPEEPKPVKREPMSVAAATKLLDPAEQAKLRDIWNDPNADDDDFDAAVRYFLKGKFIGAGRSMVEFQELKQQMLEMRKQKSSGK